MESTSTKSEVYDVVIIGAGIAGMSAALSASEHGAKVAVLERTTKEESGGNTRYTEAFLRMRSIDEPSEDFEERLLQDFMGYPDLELLSESLKDYDQWPALLRSMNVLDVDVVSTFAKQAGPTLQWLRDLGVGFDQADTPFISTSTTRLAPIGGGWGMLEALAAQAVDRTIDFHYETTGRSLMRGTDGAVTGLVASGPAGEQVIFQGRVILASGGFEGNAHLLARYMGNRAMFQRPVARGGQYNKGEGIEMGLEIGAAPAGNFSMFHAEPIDPRSSMAEPAVFIFPYGILVNSSGMRFTDEAPGPVDAWYERVTRRIYEQEQGIAWVILDQRVEEIPRFGAAIRTDQPPIVADTIDALGAALGLPVEQLVKTIEAYNAACKDGEFDPLHPDGLSTAGLVPPKSNWARTIEVGPFRAYPIISANVFTFGGLKVTAQAEVVDNDGLVIPGLFAAGEIMGTYFTNYTGSTSVLKGAVFGRIAGRVATTMATS